MMQEISQWPGADRRRIKGVFTDIDDTLTTDGAITRDALAALGALREAGVPVIAITGRPVGWSEPFAQSWPVEAIVAENGAVALRTVRAELVEAACPERNRREPALASSAGRSPWPSSGQTVLARLYQQDNATRLANHAQMQRVLDRIEREVAGARRATDSAGRETDIAIDHSEFERLDDAQIAAVVALMRSEGMNATVSSIHINGWFGKHNKWQGACWIVRELWGRDLQAEIGQWAFVGDSTNDVLMFEAFPQSIGVANVRRFEAQLAHTPRYITQGERGAGFAEVASALLAART